MVNSKKNRSLLWLLSLIVAGMFSFGFVLVPIYNVMCKQLGINGKTGGVSAVANAVDSSRLITVEFVTTNNEYLQWDFYPKEHKIRLHPGEMRKIEFFAKNRSDHAMTVQAIPSVSPSQAAKYLKKTECFCFAQQRLTPSETMDMPVLFHLDPELPKNVGTITLSYTLFDVTDRSGTTGKTTGRIN